MTDITSKLEQKILSEKNIDEIIDTNESDIVEMSLADYLDLLLKKYNKQKKMIILDTDIDMVYGYQIFSGIKKNPSRDLLLQIAFAFPVNIDELKHILYYGHCEELYPRNKRDAYIMFGLHNKYPLDKINDYLTANNLKPLS